MYIARCISQGVVLTERPVASEHVGEVGDDVEGGVDDVGHGEVDDEVVRHRAHAGVGHHNPYDWGGSYDYDKYNVEKDNHDYDVDNYNYRLLIWTFHINIIENHSDDDEEVVCSKDLGN